jgi:hypothetical protein
VNPEYARSTRAVAVYPVENTLDETFFEFSHGLVKENSVLHHLTYEPFQLILQFSTLQKVNHHAPGVSLLIQFVPYQDAVGFAVFCAGRADDIGR